MTNFDDDEYDYPVEDEEEGSEDEGLNYYSGVLVGMIMTVLLELAGLGAYTLVQWLI